MGKFTLTNKARSDLKSIAAYTQRKWGKDQRRAYVLQFDDAFHMLLEHSYTGIQCNYINEGYRKFPVGSHIIFYRNINQTDIEVVRILHKRMDAKEQLGKDR